MAALRRSEHSTVRNRCLEPLVVFVAASPSLYGASERTTRAWSNPMLPSEGPGCFVYLSSSRSTVGVAQCGVFVFVALVPRCRHMLLHVGRSDRWFSLPIIRRCWSLSLVQSPVEPALRLAWHAQPTESPRLPRFQERGFCHSRQRRDTRDERGHRFGSDRRDFASWRSYGTPASFRAELHDEEGHGCSGSRVAGRKS